MFKILIIYGLLYKGYGLIPGGVKRPGRNFDHLPHLAQK
jgi:hypothetical protein